EHLPGELDLRVPAPDRGHHVRELTLDLGHTRARAEAEVQVDVAGGGHEGRLVGPAAFDGSDAPLGRHQPGGVALRVLGEPLLELLDDDRHAHDRLLVRSEVPDPGSVESAFYPDRDPREPDPPPGPAPSYLGD